MSEDWGDVDRREWPRDLSSLMRDDSVLAGVPHEFDHLTMVCTGCGRGYHEICDGDNDPGCVQDQQRLVDYSTITRDMVAGA